MTSSMLWHNANSFMSIIGKYDLRTVRTELSVSQNLSMHIAPTLPWLHCNRAGVEGEREGRERIIILCRGWQLWSVYSIVCTSVWPVLWVAACGAHMIVLHDEPVHGSGHLQCSLHPVVLCTHTLAHTLTHHTHTHTPHTHVDGCMTICRSPAW